MKKYTEQQLREAVSVSFSISQVLQRLNVIPAGGNYETIKKAITVFNIDNSHFTGQGHYKGKTHRNHTRPLVEILVYGNYEHSCRLKNRLLRDGVKKHVCERCFLTEWFDEPIPLELHHMDGDRLNHLLDNLKLLCPNCHAKTGNYRGKNKKV